MKGFVEVILFPEVFKASAGLLRSGDPIILRGTLDLSEEQAGEGRAGQPAKAKIIGKEVQPLPEPSAGAQGNFRIKVSVDALTVEQLGSLKEMILAHPGRSRVLLHFTNGGKENGIVLLSDRYAVDPSSDFQSGVKRLLEACTVSLD
jgi:DNA polymerase-3 subunit alpha